MQKKYEDSSSLLAILNQHLEKWEATYGTEKSDRAPEERFAYIIDKIYKVTGKQVVILIDEYDKPLLCKLLVTRNFRMIFEAR